MSRVAAEDQIPTMPGEIDLKYGLGLATQVIKHSCVVSFEGGEGHPGRVLWVERKDEQEVKK